MLVTFICIDLLTSRNDVVFQYESESEQQALEMFELETRGGYEINETFIEEV